MKKNDKKIREPYEPKDTPKPPQIIDPNIEQQRENPVEGDSRSKGSRPTVDDDKRTEKQHLLSDETDIDDETTI